MTRTAADVAPGSSARAFSVGATGGLRVDPDAVLVGLRRVVVPEAVALHDRRTRWPAGRSGCRRRTSSRRTRCSSTRPGPIGWSIAVEYDVAGLLEDAGGGGGAPWRAFLPDEALPSSAAKRGPDQCSTRAPPLKGLERVGVSSDRSLRRGYAEDVRPPALRPGRGVEADGGGRGEVEALAPAVDRDADDGVARAPGSPPAAPTPRCRRPRRWAAPGARRRARSSRSRSPGAVGGEDAHARPRAAPRTVLHAAPSTRPAGGTASPAEARTALGL